MSAPVTIRKVESPADFRAFFGFPWKLYADDPNWVPNLLSMRHELFDQRKHPAWEYMEGDYFSAWRGDQIVGTIAAYINHRHNEHAAENIGWFGAFDVYDDQEAADALLNTAADWVRGRGYEAIQGPQTFTTHEECGLLIDGFTPPILLMPYNKPYYQRLIENNGFSKTMDVYSYYYDREIAYGEHGMYERLKRVSDRALKRGSMVIRRVDARNKHAEFERLKNIYNDAWAANWGFVPMTERELDAMVASLGMFFEPQMAFFAEIGGELAGFALAIPNFNEVLLKAYPKPGTPEIISLIKSLWYWKVTRIIRGVRLPLMGVRPQYRDIGVDVALIFHILDALRPTQYDYLDAGWILETNELCKIMDKYGGHRYKTHRFYEKRLATPAP